jgi:glycosyltransferase involved in cell wall biosynthesis
MSLRGNILVLTYWPFDNALVTAYTLPYVRMIRALQRDGEHVHLVTLTPRRSRKAGPLREFRDNLAAEGIMHIDFPYRPLSAVAATGIGWMLVSLVATVFLRRISVIHAWCTPAGAIGYLLSKATGRTLVVDSLEPHAESMVETGTWSRRSVAFRWLSQMERRQVVRAKELICTTPEVTGYFERTYGVRISDYHVKPACVDLSLFDPANAHAAYPEGIDESNVVCVYAGKLGGIYLEGEVFDFFRVASEYWKARFRVLLLTAHTREEITALCRKSGVNPAIVITLLVPHAEVPSYLALGSFGICPVKPVPTKKYCTPIKNGEYWAMGLPVVITRDISVDSDLITASNAGYVLRALTDAEYLNAVEGIDQLLAQPGLGVRIRGLARRYRDPRIAEAVYASIYA